MSDFKMMNFNSIQQTLNGDPFANLPMTDIDIGRESLPLIELSTSFGRESLGILKLGCDINNHFNNPTYPSSVDVSPNILDQAFLLSSHSDIKSSSMLKSSNFSLNLKRHEQISPINIFDFPNSLQYSHDVLNDGFLYTNSLSEKLLQQYRSRFNSLPVYTNNNEAEKPTINKMRNKTSEGCQINSSILEEKGNEFNDSVFMEACHLATKFNDEGTRDGFILDDTDPPELINGDLESNNNSVEEKIKCDSEEVFKKIDKLLPAGGLQQLKERLDTKQKGGFSNKEISQSCDPKTKIKTDEKVGGVISITDSTNQNEEISNVEPKDNLLNKPLCDSNLKPVEVKSEIVNGYKCMKSNECGEINIKQPDEILQALSVILAKNDRSEKETQQGQCLLNALAEMLSNNFKEKNESHDTHLSTDESNKQPSISSKSARENHVDSKKDSSSSFPKKTLRTKLTVGVARSPSFDGSKTRNSVSSAESSVEVRNYSAENPTISLKLKKGNPTSMKRGPLKATVPMVNLIKPPIKGTPTRAAQILPKLKSRISTPIRDIQMKPVAQSTPDNKVNNSSSSMELTNIRSLSSNTHDKSNRSSSVTSSYRDSTLPRDYSHVSQLPRRNSISECRKSSAPDVKRSSSMKETSLMKAMNKIRHNISVPKVPLRDSSNLSSRESFNSSGKIITTPKRVVRPVGKENTSALC